MQRKFLLAAAAISATIIVMALLVLFASPQNGLLVEGVLIDAGPEDPYALFAGISSREKFLISPQMNEKTASVDHAIFGGSALFLQVLEGNGRQTVHVIRVYSKERELMYCLTNFGDVNRSERLEAGPCQEFLKEENAVLVMIQFPDESLPRPVLEVSKDQIVVKSASQDEIADASFLALRIMFKNAQEVIESSTIVFDRLIG